MRQARGCRGSGLARVQGRSTNCANRTWLKATGTRRGIFGPKRKAAKPPERENQWHTGRKSSPTHDKLIASIFPSFWRHPPAVQRSKGMRNTPPAVHCHARSKAWIPPIWVDGDQPGLTPPGWDCNARAKWNPTSFSFYSLIKKSREQRQNGPGFAQIGLEAAHSSPLQPAAGVTAWHRRPRMALGGLYSLRGLGFMATV